MIGQRRYMQRNIMKVAAQDLDESGNSCEATKNSSPYEGST